MNEMTGMRVCGLALVLGFAAGCSHGSHASSEVKASAATAKVRVDTVVVTEEAVPRFLRLTGELSSNERTDLAANAAGRVTQTFVERGDHVVKGAVLAQLDARSAALVRAEAQANVTSAAVQLANAQSECERYTGLLAKGAITPGGVREAAHQLPDADREHRGGSRARAAEAAQTLTDSLIRAPFGGVIAERFVHVGDYVHADTRVVTLLVDDPLRLELTVPEANVASVHAGLVVSFETVALPGRPFTATVKYLGGEIRAATRDLVVEAVTENPDHTLLPGMFVAAQLPVGEETLPVVPVTALVTRSESRSVFVVADAHLVERVVQVGSRVNELVAIEEGVNKGDRIVVSPPPGAADGVQTE